MSRFIAWTDVASVALAMLLAPVLLLRVLECAPDLDPLGLSVGLLTGYLLADVASGVVHWFCDNYFSPTTRFVGPMFIASFREHHVDQTAIVRHGMCQRNGNNCLAAIPVLTLALFMFEESGNTNVWLDVVRGFLVGFASTLCFTNQIHAWAHSARVPWHVRLLQQTGLLLTPEHHRKHHEHGDRDYAVVSGWSNGVLNVVLPRLERLFATCGFHASPGSLES